MEKKKYEEIVSKHKPTETRGQNAFIAFVTGGIVGVIGQVLTECYSTWFDISTKDASTFMLVTLIFLASLFTALGFAHSMTSAGIEYRKEGPIFGLGSNIFKLAGSVILYGVVSAWFFGLLRLIIMGG